MGLVVMVCLIGAAVSVGLVVRDVRRLHRQSRAMCDAPGDAAGVSPAGLIFGNSLPYA